MANSQAFLMACLAAVLLTVLPSLLTRAEAKFSLSSFKSDLFAGSRRASHLVPEKRSRSLGESEYDPCLKYSDVESLPAGHPCATAGSSGLMFPHLGGGMKVGNQPPGVGRRPPGVGKHPPGVGKHPPGVGGHRRGVGRHPPGVGRHPPGVGRHPPGVGKHPPGVGKHPPGVGKHPPGVGKHPPGVGGRRVGGHCNLNVTRCLDPSFNLQLAIEPTTTTCCSKTCRSLQFDRKHCGACFNKCRTASGGPDCCSASCTDLLTDSLNCGTCGNACAAGVSCVAGVCVDYGR